MTQQEFHKRRQALLAQMAPASAAVILPHRKRRVVQTLNILIVRTVISGI